MRAYRNMLSRVRGVQWRKAHLYQGLPILAREDFYAWSLANDEFWRLFQVWRAEGYERRICPSVNRINAAQGYLPGNIEWITHSENSAQIRRAA